MESFYSTDGLKSSKAAERLRAYVEICNGKVTVLPIADSDEQARKILKALRVVSAEQAA